MSFDVDSVTCSISVSRKQILNNHKWFHSSYDDMYFIYKTISKMFDYIKGCMHFTTSTRHFFCPERIFRFMLFSLWTVNFSSTTFWGYIRLCWIEILGQDREHHWCYSLYLRLWNDREQAEGRCSIQSRPKRQEVTIESPATCCFIAVAFT